MNIEALELRHISLLYEFNNNIIHIEYKYKITYDNTNTYNNESIHL